MLCACNEHKMAAKANEAHFQIQKPNLFDCLPNEYFTKKTSD